MSAGDRATRLGPTLLAAVLCQCAAEEGSMAQLARAVGISRQTLHELVTSTRAPGRHVTRALAAYLSGRQRDLDPVTPDTVREWASTVSAPSEI